VLSWSLFLPLVVAAVGYAVLSAIAGVMSNRGNEAGAERIRNYAFLVVLAMGAWTVVLLLMSIFSEPSDVWDMIVVTLIVVAFFVLLLLSFFAISLLIAAIGRAMSRRRRVTTDEL
jgi:hypothetical protein